MFPVGWQSSPLGGKVAPQVAKQPQFMALNLGHHQRTVLNTERSAQVKLTDIFTLSTNIIQDDKNFKLYYSWFSSDSTKQCLCLYCCINVITLFSSVKRVFTDFSLKVPGPISQNEDIYANIASSPKKSWFVKFQLNWFYCLDTRRDYVFCNCLYLTM